MILQLFWYDFLKLVSYLLWANIGTSWLYKEPRPCVLQAGLNIVPKVLAILEVALCLRMALKSSPNTRRVSPGYWLQTDCMLKTRLCVSDSYPNRSGCTPRSISSQRRRRRPTECGGRGPPPAARRNLPWCHNGRKPSLLCSPAGRQPGCWWPTGSHHITQRTSHIRCCGQTLFKRTSVSVKDLEAILNVTDAS